MNTYIMPSEGSLLHEEKEENKALADNIIMSSQSWETPCPKLPAGNHKVLLGPNSTKTACPLCYAVIRSSVRYTVTTRTHMIAALLICCCCCIPYCMNSTRNSDHYCPNCGDYIGTYKK